VGKPHPLDAAIALQRQADGSCEIGI